MPRLQSSASAPLATDGREITRKRHQQGFTLVGNDLPVLNPMPQEGRRNSPVENGSFDAALFNSRAPAARFGSRLDAVR